MESTESQTKKRKKNKDSDTSDSEEEKDKSASNDTQETIYLRDSDASDNESTIFPMEEDANIISESVKTRALLHQFTNDQTHRYEYFKRSSLNKNNVKKVTL